MPLLSINSGHGRRCGLKLCDAHNLDVEATVVNKLLGMAEGGVKLCDAHNLDAKVLELAFVESLDSGQLPLAVGSPVGPEDDEGRGTDGISDLEVVARHGGRGEVWGDHPLAGRYGGLTCWTRPLGRHWRQRVGISQCAVDVTAGADGQGGRHDQGYARKDRAARLARWAWFP